MKTRINTFSGNNFRKSSETIRGMTAEKSIRINKNFPKSIAKRLLYLDAEELKKIMITENGLTIAEEERILRQIENPSITATLKTEKDIDDYFGELIDEEAGNLEAMQRSIHVDKEFPESIAKRLLYLDAEELKKIMITENGFTIAEEERILRAEKESNEEEGEIMTSDEFIEYLKKRL